MATSDSDNESLFLFLLLIALYDEDDPVLVDMTFDRLRRRLQRTEFWVPELDELLYHRLRRGPLGERRRSESRSIAKSMLEGYRQGFEGFVNQRLGATEHELGSLRTAQAELRESLDHQAQEQRAAADDFHSYVWLINSGANVDEARIIRYIPTRIYVSDPVPAREVLDEIGRSVELLLGPDEFGVANELPEESGSWWKRAWLKTKLFFSRADVQDRIGKAERAVLAAYLDKPQAEANEHQANAASRLIASLEGTSRACVQVGTLLLVKATNSAGESALVARTLTPGELKQLEEHQTMLRHPEQILEWLETGNAKALA